MAPLSTFTTLSDHELLTTVHRLAAGERVATASLIASLAELDSRRLYLGEGCSSMFTYCTQILHLSEHAAYGRIEAARLARRFPVILELLVDGAITLTAIGLLAPHLTADNHHALLAAAQHKTKRAVEQLVAALRPQPPVPAFVRRLPSTGQTGPSDLSGTMVFGSTPPSSRDAVGAHVVRPAEGTVPVQGKTVPSASARRTVVRPLAPERYKVQFTMDASGEAQLRRAQALMRHRVPDGDVGVIFTQALALLVERLETTKLATTDRPRPASSSSRSSRSIPAAVRRRVWARDEGRCAFVGAHGRCTETGFLEFHHVRPFAAGGEAVAGNIELRCRAHNQYEAELFFGVPPPTARERAGASEWTT